jgi:MFS family permease
VASAQSISSERPFRRLWQRPGYRSFVLTVSLSRTTASMFNTAGVLLVLARTGSASLAGATVAASVLPTALTGPLFGAWLDIARRRRVLIVFDQFLSVAALLALLAVAGHAPGWTVLAVAVLYSITRPFTAGSFFSAMAEISGPELLDQASAMEATSINLAVLVGPGLAGILAGAIGAPATIEVQIGLTALVAVLVARNPAFEARPSERADDIWQALRSGLVALGRIRVLLATTVSSSLASFAWGLMLVGFPVYAVRMLHSRPHDAGYLWAAVAGGSILGTFILKLAPRRRSLALSYLAIALSTVLWLLAGSLIVGFLLILLTGFVEGPAWSGTIALRQRHVPPAVRGQVQTTISGVIALALAAGAALGGAIPHPGTLIAIFVAANVLAALASVS